MNPEVKPKEEEVTKDPNEGKPGWQKVYLDGTMTVNEGSFGPGDVWVPPHLVEHLLKSRGWLTSEERSSYTFPADNQTSVPAGEGHNLNEGFPEPEPPQRLVEAPEAPTTTQPAPQPASEATTPGTVND